MAKYTGADAWVIVDGVDVTGYALEFTAPAPTVAFEDSHTLGDSWREQLPVDMREWSASISGFFDDDEGGFVEAFEGKEGLATASVLLWGVGGTTAGTMAGSGSLRQVSFAPQTARGALTKAVATFRGEGQANGGGVLLRKGSITGASGDGTAVNNGAATTEGGAAGFSVAATAGNVVQKVRHSTDGSTYADLATAAQVGTGDAPAAQIVVVAGTVNQYLRQSFTNSGASYTGAVTFTRY